MNVNMKENLVHIVILDVSGVYAQIHNQGYFDKVSVQDIKEQYKDSKWKIIILQKIIKYNTKGHLGNFKVSFCII